MDFVTTTMAAAAEEENHESLSSFASCLSKVRTIRNSLVSNPLTVRPVTNNSGVELTSMSILLPVLMRHLISKKKEMNDKPADNDFENNEGSRNEQRKPHVRK